MSQILFDYGKENVNCLHNASSSTTNMISLTGEKPVKMFQEATISAGNITVNMYKTEVK